MSWRADIWQQLLQLRARVTRLMRNLLGTWPGLLTLTLLLLALGAGGLWLHASSDAVHAARPAAMPLIMTDTPPIEAGLAQLVTRVPTRRATPARTATSTRTATATRSPTPTWTPQPTATQAAGSPLLVLPQLLAPVTHVPTVTLTPTDALTPTVSLTPVVPLPVEQTGPQIAPVDVVTASHPVTGTITPTITPTPTTDVMLLLVPTPTPTATPSIVEALEQPVGGLAGIAATATAAAPVNEESASSGSEPPAVSEAGAVAASVAPPPTVAVQPTPDGNARSAHVPILMYHYLSAPPADADIYRLDLSVPPDRFAAHLDAIQQAGYTTISLYALVDHLTRGTPLPDKPVILTFDDGYRDNYENAFPLLHDHGMIATFFIVTDFINDGRAEYLTWDEVREMYAAGMSIEGHGRNHVSLANKDNDYLVWQALGTYESIEHEIGVRPRFISYPAGEYDQRTLDIFRSAGYWAGVTTQQGATHSSDSLLRLKRVRVRGTTTPEELLRLLALDW